MYSSILFEAEPNRICQKLLNRQYCVTASKSKIMPMNICQMYCWIMKLHKLLKSQIIQAFNIWQTFPWGPKDFLCGPKNTERMKTSNTGGTTWILFEAELNRIHHTYLKETAGLREAPPQEKPCIFGHCPNCNLTQKPKLDYYNEIPYPETRFDTDFTQISGPN